MHKLHVTLIAGLLATAAVLGTVAATHTVSLGASHTRSSDAAVRARSRQLNRFEASLHRALAKKPPALPAIPATPPAGQAGATGSQPRVVYRRPPAIVVVRHTHYGDDGGTREASDGEGGAGGD
jgi:hypothetical protein